MQPNPNAVERPLTLVEKLEQAVNARELYEFLGSKRQFANWIKERIESYEFVENVDYVVFNNFVKNPKGGRSSIDSVINALSGNQSNV